MLLIDTLLTPLTLAALIGSATVGGIFFAFSNFVMRALGRIPAESGIAAIQAINVTVLNPGFMLCFVGTAALCLPLAAFAVLRWPHPAAAWLLAGAVLYLAGSFLVTGMANVPLNHALARLDPAQPGAASVFHELAARWTRWNHVRTAASLLAALAFGVGVRAG